MILRKHLSQEPGLTDLLNYAHCVQEGIILNKDGAYLTTYKFQGPDMSSASGAELDALTANFNRMVTYLDDGWMLHLDELRVPSLAYPKKGSFPESVSSLIDEERRQLYEAEGAHFENLQFLTFVWKFPLPLIKNMRHWFVEGLSDDDDEQNLTTLLTTFQETVERCVGLLRSQFVLKKLDNAELLSYLNTCISGDLLPVAVPARGAFVDVALGRRNLVGGYSPKIGDKHIIILSLLGYLNEETHPGLLETLGTYSLVYRWSNRFIPLSENTAAREIKRYQRNWNNKVKGFAGIIKEVVFGSPSTQVDIDALQMSGQTTEAATANSQGNTRFGYWASTIVLMHENLTLINEAAKDIISFIEQSGFACIKEDINALDAWLGTIPGHGSCNVRRIFLHAINLAHVLPLHSLWAGAPHSATSSLLPAQSPPVFYAATTGKTPFRFNLDVEDVGHQMVIGPTGSGKSTYLGFLIAQFLRYEGAKVYVFDKDYSHQALAMAMGGHHYDIGKNEELSFCPLADLATETKKVRAQQFIEELVILQHILLTPDIRQAIHNAIESLAHDCHSRSRNLTIFHSHVQHEAVRAALQYYTLAGQIKLLDATHDSMQRGHLHTFEMHWLLHQQPEIFLPVLRYIFNHIESYLEESNGQHPTLIVLEEAWFYLSHEIFARKLKDWLKTLRKKNARVVFVTQSLADLYDPSTQNLTATTAAILESCPTRVYLPNSLMDVEIQKLYQKLGLSERQIEIIQHIGLPKHHYYVVTPQGQRLIELGFAAQSMALQFIGLSKIKSQALIDCYAKYQEQWVYYWLMQNNAAAWAEYWKKHYYNKKEIP